MKKTCSVCGDVCGWSKIRIKDNEWICPKCFTKAGITASIPIREISAEEIKHFINLNKINAEKLAAFTATKAIGNYLRVDENKKQWYIPDGLFGKTKNPKIHSYDEVLDYELLEDGNSVAKGGLGRAVAGGVLFGGVGAVVGGVTGKKKSKSTCTSLRIKITLNNMLTPTEYINIITTETKKSSLVYKTSEQQAQQIISVFQIMCEQKKSESTADDSQTQEISSADEIKKYKELLDSGIITQEEFDLKKKQLLGL